MKLSLMAKHRLMRQLARASSQSEQERDGVKPDGKTQMNEIAKESLRDLERSELERDRESQRELERAIATEKMLES